MNELNEIYYSKDDFEKIIELFTENNVKLEFENPIVFLNAIQKISKYCIQKEIELAFEKSKIVSLIEFDIQNRQAISTGAGYPYSSVSIVNDEKIKLHLKILCEMFSFYPKSIINFFSSYMLMNSVNTNQIEQYYYWVESEMLSDIEKDSWEEVLSIFNLSENTINFLANHYEYLCIDYVGFDSKNQLSKVGFSTALPLLLNNNPSNYYLDYKNLDKVLVLIEKFFGTKNSFISLQYSCQEEDYFSLETFMPPSKSNDFFEEMHEYGIISDDEYQNFKEMNIPKEYINSVVKFRWSNKDKFCIKFYLEKYED
jgi:hypothetical protein